MSKKVPIPIGAKIGRLTVLSETRKGSGKLRLAYICKCDCGTERVFFAENLKRGLSKSCGCWVTKILKPRKTHGLTKSKSYKCWLGMLARCRNPNNHAYKDYGGRGISVCDRWRTFENFLEDMGERPAERSLDRIDVNGDYSPENCRWATWTEQQRNRRSNHRIEFQGQTKCFREWAETVGIDVSTLRRRFNCGWPLEKILTMPSRQCQR